MIKPLLLIVDDIYANRVLLAEIVSEIGCDYKLANNGKEAIDKLLEFPFDMVLMDLEMPVMNGLETTRYIRKLDNEKSSIPIIALTAHDPNEFNDEFNSAGFNKLLTKPYLMVGIQRIIEEFHQHK